MAVIDCFTHYILQYLETLAKSSKATLQDFVRRLLCLSYELTRPSSSRHMTQLGSTHIREFPQSSLGRVLRTFW